MNIVYEGTPEHPLTCITLSRKNLEGLLFQLDRVQDKPGEAAQCMRLTENGRVIVVAEEDAVHYADRGGVEFSGVAPQEQA